MAFVKENVYVLSTRDNRAPVPTKCLSYGQSATRPINDL